jgi:glycosyltransferase involved in cell wall biosynthesis
VRSIVESGVTGVVVDGDDRGALAGALADLLARPDHRRSMGRAARDRCAARFGLATVADQWEEALLPLLADD